jgi:hypothetical protein
MMSSPQALATQLRNMAAKGSVSESVADAAKQLADANPITAKLDGLLKLVRELRRERPTDWRLVGFTLRKETQEASRLRSPRPSAILPPSMARLPRRLSQQQPPWPEPLSVSRGAIYSN